ncbi:MAG: anti-sigma factor [Anaerolineae bacterium]|nr:anti-sigma factor [Anaerolineae bacterium]
MNANQHSNPANDCDALIDLIPEYAFGLTDPEQTQLVEANLSRCPGVAARLREYQQLQEEMRAAVPQLEPPAQLGARLMAAIAEPATPAAPAPVAAAKPRRTIRAAWLVAAAAGIALIVTNAYWLSRVADLTQSSDLLRTLISAQDSSPFVLTSTDALHWVRLANPEGSDSAAFMMWNSESKTGLLYAHAFPELQAGYKYHVWLTRPNERVFMGILQVDADGNGALLFNSPEPINDFAWAWVTAETGDGTPDAPAVVKGELTPA